MQRKNKLVGSFNMTSEEAVLRQALLKAASFCAYQERTRKEVHQKLADWGIERANADGIVAELEEQKYLNEERFARVFAGSKFRQKKWGRLKIKQEMKMRGLPNDLIQMGLSEIDGDDYESTLLDLLTKKNREVRNDEPRTRQQKILRFGLSKGYESDIIWEIMKQLG